MDKKGEFFVSNTGYLITGKHLEYILALLNSQLIEYVFRKFYSISIGEKGLRWLAQYVENLPIVKPKLEAEKKINTLLFKNDYKGIDEIVYNLYNLTKNEVETIENQ